MDTPAMWFLVSGLLVLLVSRRLRVATQHLAVRRDPASAGT